MTMWYDNVTTVYPPIVTCEDNGDAVPRPQTSGNGMDGKVQHT